MTKQDRTTLKAYFRDGALPTAKHYRDLIDSSVNQVEDGFEKTPADGLILTSVGASPKLLSLYNGLGAAHPSWTLEHGDAPGSLHFRQGKGPEADRPSTGAAHTAGGHAMSLTADGRLGVNVAEPGYRLDVDGVARMSGRIGQPSPGYATVPADGLWHDITDAITGCQAFEIMAGAGGEKEKGRYSLLHAIAMNTYHPRNPILNWLFRRRPIKATTAMYGSYADRIRLKWVADRKQHHFRLRIRTNAKFGDGYVIRYYLTRLWFDSEMEGSRGGATKDEDVT